MCTFNTKATGIFISYRFPDTQLMTSLSVLGLRPITFLNDTELHDWGNEAIQRLVDFYGKDQQHEYTDPETKSKEVSKSEALVDPVAVKVNLLLHLLLI